MAGPLTGSLLRAGMTAAWATGFHRLIEPYTAGHGAVLMFHRVRPDTGNDFAPNALLEIRPEFLARLVGWIRDRDIDIVDLDEALKRLADREARRFCVLTFDDGYRDNLEFALPILKAAGAPFTVYLTTGLIDRTIDLWWEVLEQVIAARDEVAIEMDGPTRYFTTGTTLQKCDAYDAIRDWLFQIDEDRQRSVMRELAWRYEVDGRAMVEDDIMTWGEVRQLAAEPLVTIGAHSVGHFMLSKLPESRARAEIRDSARVIEAALGIRPRHFAYPYGFKAAAGEREFRLAAEQGYTTAVTTRRGVIVPAHAARPTAWPRVSVNGHFQAVRYLDLLMSGMLYAVYDRFVGEAESAGHPHVRAAASR